MIWTEEEVCTMVCVLQEEVTRLRNLLKDSIWQFQYINDGIERDEDLANCGYQMTMNRIKEIAGNAAGEIANKLGPR